MLHSIPSDFPKVWPYDPAYRNHVIKALSLNEAPVTVWHMLQAGGKLLIILGLPIFIIPNKIFSHFLFFNPAKIFAYSFLLGIILWILFYPLVNYVEKKQKREFLRIMDEAKKQVSAEKKELKLKATADAISEDADDQDNIKVMLSYINKHYTPNWAWIRHKLLVRDKFSCCLCGRHVQLADSVAHHIDAFSEGGKTEFGNLITICVDCHSVIHPWLNSKLNLFWIRFERGRVYCWKCKKRLDTEKSNITICSDCGWLYHINDCACGCNYPQQ